MKIKYMHYAMMLIIIASPFIKAQRQLDEYIKLGLENNIVLRQKQISLEKAVFSLKTAASLYLPSVSLQAGYTHGSGGRGIAIPVGDMLNPVYQTLNALTASNRFPQIDNVREDFMPKKFYDVKIRASMPLLNTDIYYNHSIQGGQKEIKEYEAEIYKRELVKEIKTAYYNFLCATEAVRIYKNAYSLILESKRVNESLLANGAGLPAYVVRAESDLAGIEAQIAEAERQVDMARQAFNCLLNRELKDTVLTDAGVINNLLPETPESSSPEMIARREEYFLLDKAVAVNGSVVNMNKLFWVPKINMFMDLGMQDQVWKSRAESKYSLFGIQLDLPLFEGFRSSNKVSESELDLKNTELVRENVRKQLLLAANDARGKLLTSVENYQSSRKQLESASAYYRLVTRGYQEGKMSFLETLEGRVQLTNAELNVTINKYKILIAQAAWERESAQNTKIDKD